MLWRDAALAAQFGTLAFAALSIGFGCYGLDMARWGVNVFMSGTSDEQTAALEESAK